MHSRTSRIVSGIVGLALIVFGASLLLQPREIDTSRLQAIASLVVALGVAAVGAAILPGSIEADGKEVKPFGLSLQATGGFALFVITLLFLMSFPGQQTGTASTGNAGSNTGQRQIEQPATFYQVETFCSVCCPQGKYECPSVGRGSSTSFQQAAAQAVSQCMMAGGQQWSCEANVIQLSP